MNPPLSPQTQFLPIPTDDPHLPTPLHTTARWWRRERRSSIHSGVIRSVCRYFIVSVVVVFVALKISTLCTWYHQLTSSIKNWLCQLLHMPHLKNWHSRFAMKCTLEWELRFKRVYYCTSFWQRPHDIKPKTADQVQSYYFKKSISVFCTSVCTVDRQNL